MFNNSHGNTSSEIRTLVASPRNLDFHVSLCGAYEFEDTIREIETVDLVCPQFPFDKSLVGYRLLSGISRRMLTYTGVGSSINSIITQVKCDKKYDLFLVCLRPFQLQFVNCIKYWRDDCKITACFIDELWPNQVKEDRNLLKILSNFDHIFLAFQSSVKLLEELVTRPCHYLPVGINALRFCPYPLDPIRVIDFYSIGRRSDRIHKALLKHSKEKNFFYMYDTLRNLSVLDYEEHRVFISSVAKRSRYFFVNRPKFDVESKKEGQEEIGENELGSRFLEGGAAGAVLIGARPTGAIFERQMDWLDAVIAVSLDDNNIVEIITELDAQPERLARIRRDNVYNCLMRHDWAYRWEVILKTIGLTPRPELHLRKERLKEMANYTLDPFRSVRTGRG